jgi:hypothetical protein
MKNKSIGLWNWLAPKKCAIKYVSKSFKIPDHHYFDCESKGDCKAPKCYCKPKK